MIAAAVLAALAMGCVLAAKRLTAAKWTHRAPHIGILLWQAIGVAWGLATIGALLAFALEPYGKGVFYGMAAMVTAPEYGGVESPHDVARLTALVLGLALLAVLIAVPIVAAVQTLRARRRHRDLLALIAREDPSVPGVRVVDFPAAAAYCMPGLKSQVVISDGTLSLLSPGELDAVLAHEAAHVRERHDLVLLPFGALRRALPWSGLVRDAQASVELLVEMAADDRARQRCCPKRLASALLRFGTAAVPVPQGALGASAAESVMARVERLLRPQSALPPAQRFLLLAASVALAASAPALWFLPG